MNVLLSYLKISPDASWVWCVRYSGRAPPSPTQAAQSRLLNCAYAKHLADILRDGTSGTRYSPANVQCGVSTIVFQLCEGLNTQLKNSESNEVDILAWMGRTALELIGRGGFGHSFDPLVESKPDAYGEAVKQLMYVLEHATSTSYIWY